MGPIGFRIKQTVVALAAATDTVLVASHDTRKYLAIINIGTNPASLNFDAVAVAGQGWPVNAASVAGQQGGAITWESSGVHKGAVHGISTAGTTIVVLEGF